MKTEKTQDRITHGLSEAEREIMQVMWETGDGVTASMLLSKFEDSKGWKPQTLNTFLTRLVAKGYLESCKRGNANVYSTLISKAEFESQEASEFVEKNYGGSAKRLIAALVDGGAVSDEELAELKQWFSER
ncbi:MAG: BlaI/MecI/CopY family transcriptional regulator [Oscillospiraceae bacterium]|nr:BlaI/MecI/CopY family transcriptional regulator [Oscillospiraceae bacterium]